MASELANPLSKLLKRSWLMAVGISIAIGASSLLIPSELRHHIGWAGLLPVAALVVIIVPVLTLPLPIIGHLIAKASNDSPSEDRPAHDVSSLEASPVIWFLAHILAAGYMLILTLAVGRLLLAWI